VRQAALGLQHAFENGMTHRDVKPHNLILAEDGTVKVLDFGLARVARDAEGSATGLTGAGVILGTVDYIAPEQADDPGAADVRSDIYALGCTLYHLLADRVPFPGRLTRKLRDHAEKEPPPLRTLRPRRPTTRHSRLEHALQVDNTLTQNAGVISDNGTGQLIVEGGATQTAGTIAVGNVQLGGNGNGNFTFASSTNSIGTLTATNTGAIALSNASALTLGDVTTATGDVSISSADSLTVSAAISGAGNVTLEGSGGNRSDAGVDGVLLLSGVTAGENLAHPTNAYFAS
jgi:serine/threonine protein kinase